MSYFGTFVVFLIVSESSQDGNPVHFTRPLPVRLAVSIITLGEPDLIKMRFRVELMAFSKWSADMRVCDHVNLSELVRDDTDNVVSPENVWLPDLQFLQAQESRMPASVNPPIGIELHARRETKDCHFIEKRRYSLTVKCPMDLHWFPVDVQFCPLQLQSFTYSKQFLSFVWDENFIDFDKAIQPPFRVNPAIQYLQYDVGYSLTRNSSLPWYWNQVAPGEASEGVKFTIIFYRRFAYQFLTTYIPSTAVVIAAFSALFASVELSVERINLAVITLVSLYTQIARYRITLPSTPYFTVCDIYLYACLICVVSTIIVCSVVERLYKEDVKLERLLRDDPVLRRSSTRRSRSLVRSERKNSYLVRRPSRDSIREDRAATRLANRFDWILNVPENRRRNERVNIRCRRVMILLYVLFLIVYFAYIFNNGPH